MKFYCIADEDTVRGFRLAGVDGQAVTSARQAGEVLAQVAASAEWGIVILTQFIAAQIREQVDSFRLERDRPLIVEIPGPEGSMAERRNLGQLVSSAIGMSVDKPQGA